MKELKIDLFPLINKLEVALKRGFSRDLMAGNYQSVYKGKGMEFVGFREYSPNDDAMLIDWKASLRAHKSMVKVLQEERNITVLFLLDVSDSMLFSSHSKLKCEYAAELVGTLCYAMQQVGDQVGIALFNDKVIQVVPPNSGRYQFYKIVKTLSNPANYGGKFNLSNALDYIMSLNFIQHDSILFIISDFIGLSSGWETSLKLAGIKYDLTTIIVRDPVDNRLPTDVGGVHLADPFTRREILIDSREVRGKYEEEAKTQIAKLKKELNKTRSSMLTLDTNIEFTHEIFKFFKLRQMGK